MGIDIRRLRISGNTKALSRLVAFIVCLALAWVTGSIAGIQWSAAVGAFLGAAVSLAVNWIVLTLEETPSDTPSALLKAAHEDVERAGYYRTKQVITLRVVIDEKHGETVQLRFTATLQPLKRLATVERQTIGPPAGATYIDSYYKVGGKRVTTSIDITAPTTDELLFWYSIAPDAKFLEDAHYWASPILDYIVRVWHSEKFSFEVGTIRPAGGMLHLNSIETGEQDFFEFEGKGPAFSTQGLKFNIKRKAA